MLCLQSLTIPQVSNGAPICNHDKVTVVDLHLLRQQLSEISQGVRDSFGKPLVNSDIALQAKLPAGGEVLLAMNPIEALDLARQLIAKASAQLERTAR